MTICVMGFWTIYYNVSMTRKKYSLSAFLFIPVMAFIFAGFFTVVGVIGWKLVKSSDSQAQKSAVSAPAQTDSKPTEQPGQPSRVSHNEKTVHRAQESTTPNLPTQPKERFALGLKQCMSRPAEKFPCAWQDTQMGVIKQFKMEKPGEPIVRRVYDMGGKLLSLTSFNTRQHYVILYREGDVTWFFDRNGVVRQIARVSRTVPVGGQDYYYYMVNGQLNSCLCADKTRNCCSNAPRLSSPGNRFCELFPLDQEVCSK